MMRRIQAILVLILAAMTMNVAVAQFTEERSKPAKTKKQRVEPSVAWSVSEPLGLHYTSTIDTIHLDYHRTMVPSMVSDAWLTTGNYGAPGQDQIFMNRLLIDFTETAVAVAVVSGAGVSVATGVGVVPFTSAASLNRIAYVSFPATPSFVRPWAFWKFFRAFTVSWSILPSIVPT